jgi:hypothetical protein
MYAFERATGKRLWHTDEQLEDQTIALEQFAELPLILAANQYSKFAANGNFEGQFLKFVALDKATGRLKYRKDGLPQAQFYSIAADPKAGTIDVLNYNNIRVRFVPDDGRAVGKGEPEPKPAAAGSVRPVPLVLPAPPPLPPKR